MDSSLVQVFRRHIWIQCEFIQLHWAGIQRSQNVVTMAEMFSLFASLQSLLTATANVSKALWGERGDVARRRAPLRASLAIDETSPFNQRKMRNNYDHFDARLDDWWQRSPNKAHLDLGVGPKAEAMAGAAEIDLFRHYDPVTSIAWFWGDTFDVKSIVEEANRILPGLGRQP